MANILSALRILLSLPIALAIIYDQNWLGFWLLLIAGFTDLIDGALARALGDADALGAALDPIADKILTVVTLLALVGAGQLSGVHIFAAIFIVIREFFIGGLREALGNRLSLAVTRLAKWKTTGQFVALCLLTLPIAFAKMAGLFVLWGAVALTVWTGLVYARRGLAELVKPAH